MKGVALVNGVPASGKSSTARALSQATGWPLLTLDTVKEALFEELGTGDRDYNRKLGRAAYRAMFAIVGEAPAGSRFVMDAWFGFQPRALLDELAARAGVSALAQVWCTAPPEEIGARYARRVGERSAGHLGLDYVPELIALARRAEPLADIPAFTLDTTQPTDVAAMTAWAKGRL